MSSPPKASLPWAQLFPQEQQPVGRPAAPPPPARGRPDNARAQQSGPSAGLTVGPGEQREQERSRPRAPRHPASRRRAQRGRAGPGGARVSPSPVGSWRGGPAAHARALRQPGPAARPERDARRRPARCCRALPGAPPSSLPPPPPPGRDQERPLGSSQYKDPRNAACCKK